MDELKHFAAGIFPGIPAERIAVVKLFGQASTRQYFRASIATPPLPAIRATPPPSGGGKSQTMNSVVIMKLPDGFSSPAEEITNIDPGAPRELPFLNVQAYLNDIGVKVPAVYATDADRGLVLLEDLGERTLESVVTQATPEFLLFYYRKVIDVLVDLQDRTRGGPPLTSIAAYRRFTTDLINREFDHFTEYGIESRFGVKLAGADKADIAKFTGEIANRITALPQGFTHRDFQSRNLMFQGYDFWLIDFQDALTGPVLYDLVALLRDSYIQFTPEQTDMLLRDYSDKLPPWHPYTNRPDELRRDFHLITLQRKLKDAGRFQYIATVKHNPAFLQHVPLSLECVRRAFTALPEFGELRKLLARHVPELA